MFKKMLTGNLNAPVDSISPFMGKERNLLRAQIARIQHNCQLCPKGMFEIDEETTEQKYTEEAPPTSVEDLKTLENWSHAYPIVLKVGRCTHTDPIGLDDEAKDEFMAKLAEEDKTEERFKAINEDITVPGLEAAWQSKVCGDQQQYNKVGGEGTQSYAVNVIKSMRWPGAVTVAKNGQYCNFYVGDCIKRGDNLFNPTEPPEVMADPSELEEQPEPQGKEAVEKPVAEEAPAEGDD